MAEKFLNSQHKLAQDLKLTSASISWEILSTHIQRQKISEYSALRHSIVKYALLEDHLWNSGGGKMLDSRISADSSHWHVISDMKILSAL